MDNATVNIKHDGDTRLELYIRSYAKDAVKFCEDIHAARRYIENSIGMMNPVNHVTPEHAYKVTLSEDCKAVEVWHYNVRGDKDRLLLTVTQQ